MELDGADIFQNVGIETSNNVEQYHDKDISDKEENDPSLYLNLHGDREALETPKPNIEDISVHHDDNDEENDEINQRVLNELTDESKHHTICMNNEVINY